MSLQFKINPPDEVLHTIFHQLAPYDISACEQVCRTWRLAARNSLYKVVHLKNDDDIDKFLNTLGQKPSYVQLIIRLELGVESSKSSIIDEEHVRRLVAIPLLNVKELVFYSSTVFKKFTHDSLDLQNMMKAYNNVQKIVAPSNVSPSAYFAAMISFREKLTSVRLTKGNDANELDLFPRVRELDIRDCENFPNFESWLTIFEKPVKLKTIYGRIRDEDNDNFAEKFFSTKPKREQHLIIERLAQVEELHLKDALFNSTSIQFMLHYFLGLRKFSYCQTNERVLTEWNELQQITLTHDLLNFMQKLHTCHIQINKLTDKDIVDCVPAILENVLQPRTLECSRKIFRFIWNRDANLGAQVVMKSKLLSNGKVERELEVAVKGDKNIIATITDALAKIEGITIVQFGPHNKSATNYPSTIKNSLIHMPQATTVFLHIPDGVKKNTETLRFEQVITLVVDAHFNYRDPDTITKCVSMFPNAKYLRMQYFSGSWRADSRQYRIPILNSELDRISLDLTPALLKLRDIFSKKKAFLDDPYIALCIVRGKDRLVYKVWFKHLQAKRLNETETSHVMKRRINMKIVLEVKDIKHINLYYWRKIDNKTRTERYFDTCNQDIVMGKIMVPQVTKAENTNI